MNLFEIETQKEYTIEKIETKDSEFDKFLFSLGCYGGESITVISRRKSGCIVLIKNGKYSIDRGLAKSITVC